MSRLRVLCHDNAQNRHLLGAIPSLKRRYRPTPWLFNSHLQIMLLTLREARTNSDYDHVEILSLSDGAQSALAWRGYDLPVDAPTIVVLHTISGSPASMAELVRNLHRHSGWRVVLCVRRGHAGLAMPQPRINLLGSPQDLREQLATIQARFPNSALYAVGSSAGSGLLVRYLGEEGERAPFKASFAYCPGYDTDAAFHRTHDFYSRYMARKLRERFITPHEPKLRHLRTLPALKQARTLAEFHGQMFELAGYASYEAYSAACNPMRVFHQITTPVMILNAEDDPICRIENATPYLERMQAMPNVILVTTEKGSHCAHYEGWRAHSWSAALMADYFRAIDRAASQPDQSDGRP